MLYIKKNCTIGILFSLSAGFLCCKQTVLPATDGVITGTVALFDTIGNAIPNSEGVKISVENASQFTVTDGSGNFSLSGLAIGQAALVFSKSGFAEVYNSVQVSSESHSGNVGTQPLYAIRHLSPNIVTRPFGECYARFNFRDTQIYSSAAGGMLHYWLYDSVYEQFGLTQFSSRILDAPNKNESYTASIRIYFSAQDSISLRDPNSFEFSTETNSVDNKTGSMTVDIYRDSLIRHGFGSNSKIYCAAFASGSLTKNYFFTDKTTGKKIYTSFSPIHSEIRSFILP